ncbi:MAG: hypothetical protein O3B41_07185 [Bacteroidetes bacterium]|nr:hypothetical protein [Bacteroidota bacterium]
MPDSASKVDLRFWLTVPLAGIITWTIHELAHYLIGSLLGYEMWVSLNQAGLIHGEYATIGHRLMVDMAGPWTTYLQAIVSMLLIYRLKWRAAYPFLFFAWYMRSLALGMSFIMPNDEARVSLELGLPMWLLPLFVVAVLSGMTFWSSKKLQLTWKTNAILYVAASIITALIVFLDPRVGRILGA